MTDETDAKADKPTQRRPTSERLNIYISPAARAMLAEMGEALYPSVRRADGIVVDAAIREKYAAFKRGQSKEQTREDAQS